MSKLTIGVSVDVTQKWMGRRKGPPTLVIDSTGFVRNLPLLPFCVANKSLKKVEINNPFISSLRLYFHGEDERSFFIPISLFLPLLSTLSLSKDH